MLKMSQDSCNDLVDYKTNVITLVDSENEGLKKLAFHSGGRYIHIDEDALYQYTKDGNKTITKFKK